MRVLGGFCFLLLLGGGLVAQQSHGGYINSQPSVRGGFPSVIYPGGTPATTPGLTRFNGSVVYPGGGGPGAGRAPSGGQNFRRPVTPGRGARGTGGFVAVPYAYPVYVGGYGYGYGYGYDNGGNGYDNGYAQDPSAGAPGVAPQQPNVIVIYAQPPQPAAVAPSAPPQPEPYTAPAIMSPADTPVSVLDPSHYLIAFKDHTIYSAVAYWVDDDTLHYFTSGNTHNQVSLELVDRALTERLNNESGVTMRLPPEPAGKTSK